MSLNKLKKDELKIVAEVLNLTVPEGAKIAGIKSLIINSDIYKNDKELVQSAIDYALAEIKNKILDSKTKLEFERLKSAQLQKQLELANIQKNLIQNSDIRNQSVLETAANINVETLLKSMKTLTIPLPSRVESYNLFFQSLEKAFKIKEVPEQFKGEILLNILGERVNNLLAHVSEEELNNYSKLKDLVLKEFSPTPQECYNRFQKAQKLSSESYVQFASRLCATFEYYCQLRNVNDFKSLCQLIVSDKIMSTLDKELMSHMSIKQGEKYFKPHELGRECDIYLSSKSKIKNEIFSKPFCENAKHFSYNKQNKFKAKIPRDASNVFLSELKNDKCELCKNNVHALQFCPQFKMFSINERVDFVKNNRLCFKCFSPQCSVRRYRSKNCFCSKPHNKLLHYPREMKNNSFFPLETTTEVNQDEPQFALSVSAESFVPKVDKTQIVATAWFKNKCLLSTALILVKDKYSEWQTFRALLDSGSETCLISNECANKLQLKTERINSLISCLNDASMVVNGCVKVAISNQNKSFKRELDMLEVKKITDFIPQKALEINPDFSNFVELADSNFNVPGKIDLLLSANIFYELLKPERIKIKDSQLQLVNSVFGYIVTGNLDSINETKVHCGLIRDEDLNKTLEKFSKVEEVEEPIVKNKERLICEEHYANTHFRAKEGKYIVSMPLKKEPSCLGNSKDIALKRLGSLWNRLDRDENYLNLYCEFLRDYERLGHMKEVTNETEPEITYYATHHGIYRPEKSTTKLRVVFNSSSLTDNGISLNDIQYNGGVIQEDLYVQMLRFRTCTYAFTADIKMMYRTILINPNQRNLHRIVWSESEHESPKIYELSTVTYGTVSAPYLAQRTLTQLSMDEEANFPIAASVLRNNLYMDDVLCGAATLEEAIVLRQQLKGILKRAGMELHKLCANHEKLSPGPEQNYNFATLTETKTLGVSWKPNLDCFLIKVKVCLDSSYTKRDVLSTIAKIFDPVGLMAPVISKAKIFLQRLWRSKLEWNDLLPAEEYREWQQFLVSLENINNIEIPRRILVAFPEVIEIHGFADASERCYGAAVYCKSKNLKSETLVWLITSKSRVAPIKSLTIPRLEFCAAVLLAKLVKRVVAALQLETAELYLRSDSMIVLEWLRKEPMDLKTFVQNRVAKIQELYPNQLWRHVPSDQNPADLISRGVDPDKLLLMV
ncbi:uncharacterized protein TNCV_4857301 [Trichonephila clavipes]|uniref:Reverse transcriptase domain-containing protein n=1 Tax=Trichonephila clavipes TaxID=2585209 RepID=A0A8X6USS0_TRICX|nr:uncharacterized protein TNCV_4857301 [Trichonephila clavipes]